MQAIAWKIQSLRRDGGIENRENSFDRIQQVGANPTAVAAFIEPLEPAMLKTPNHQSTL